MDPDLSALAPRLGERLFNLRLERENRRLAVPATRWTGDDFLSFLLRLGGLATKGRANVLNLRIEQHDWVLPTLPRSLDRFRLLQLSDLHLDLDDALPSAIILALAAAADLDPQNTIQATVITGDFSQWKLRNATPALAATLKLLPHFPQPAFAILGNHDRLNIIPTLESAGLRCLLNEAAPMVPPSSTHQGLWLVGIDDPAFFRTHDFAAAQKNVPENACQILLSHSPEVAEAAAQFGFALCLAGHTHGGQICLPNGKALVLPTKNLPPAWVAGRWQAGPMPGYTSRGTGSCGVNARFNCPPEITLHTLYSPPR